MLTAEDYKKAIDVQDGCNLSGIAQSLAEVIKRIEGGTDFKNTHPIVQMYVYKMYTLAFPTCNLPEGFSEPYLVCKDVADNHNEW